MKPLHYKKHTPAKRFLSLLCVLALCLGLLPVTALAEGAAPDNLYVGDQVLPVSLDSYWTTSTDGKLTKSSDDQSWNVKYEPDTATLTLQNAKISGSNDHTLSSYGAGIYAQCSNGQSVALTIKLIGENTITGNYGIFLDAEISTTSYGTNATLTITSENNGSLGVSGSDHGIYVKSGTGNASLNIEKATVTSSTNDDYAAGVFVSSSTKANVSPNLSLAVNGGSLTTSGTGNSDGILFYVGSSQATDATTSLTVSENAIVRAKNGTKAVPVDKPTPSGTGIVFDDKEGTVYGDVTLEESLTINQGETLTIGKDASLNANGNLTNNGTINVESGGTVTGSLSGGSMVTTPSISAQPTGQTVIAGSTATFAVTASNVQSYQWQQSVNGGNNWTNIVGATAASYTIDNTTTDMSDYQYRCVVTSASGVSVISQAANLTVQAKPASVPVTDVSLDKGTISLFTGESETLTAMVVPVTATDKSVTWSSDKPEVATVENGKVTAKAAGTATITVTTQDGGKTDTCTVTVTEQPSYSISATPATQNFGSIYDGQSVPAAQTVTITNTGNQAVTLNPPTAENFEIGALSKTELAPNATASFTIQPKDKLPRGSYSEQITITGDNNVSETLTATFTVKEPPYTGKYSYELSTSVGDHGSLSVDRYATEGEKVTITVTPDEAYKLDDLSVTAGGKEVTLTAGGDGTYTFTMPSADVKITATFAEDPDWTEPEEPATDVSDIFIDVAPNAWYKDAVQYAYAGGLMTGVSANEFAPEQTTTRAMIVSMLARLEGVESAEAAGFADVDDNDWYATAVNWAANVGVVNGYEDNTFRPNTAITREQLAAILMNYAAYKGYDVSARADLSHYSDADSISSWANDVLLWAVAEGLLTGVTDDTIAPQAHATRAQVAAILQRFLSE